MLNIHSLISDLLPILLGFGRLSQGKPLGRREYQRHIKARNIPDFSQKPAAEVLRERVGHGRAPADCKERGFLQGRHVFNTVVFGTPSRLI